MTKPCSDNAFSPAAGPFHAWAFCKAHAPVLALARNAADACRVPAGCAENEPALFRSGQPNESAFISVFFNVSTPEILTTELLNLCPGFIHHLQSPPPHISMRGRHREPTYGNK